MVEHEAEFPGLLRREIQGWLDSVRFWEKSSNWLQAGPSPHVPDLSFLEIPSCQSSPSFGR